MLSRRWARMRAVRPIMAFLVTALVIAACAGTPGAAPGPEAPGDPGSGGGGLTGKPATGAGGEVDAGGGGSADGGTVRYLAGQPDLQIIKTGTMALQVTGIDAAIDAAGAKISALGGYASGSKRAGDGDGAVASVTYRIPAARWEEALAALRGLATKVLAEQASTEDVTSQIVDLGARITNLQATERALQGVMAQATEIKDILAVQAELTKVRGEIEQLTAQKTHLQQQAAMSTLDVSFSLKPNPVLTSQEKFDPASEADRAAASLVGVLQALATAGIWFAIVWLPILLALGIIVLVAVFVARRVRRSGGSASPPTTPVPAAGD